MRPLTRGLVQPINRSLLGRKLGGDALTAGTKALFASGEKGVMFDFSKASNLYTDSARTTPVVATNDQIGSVTDLSPNGKHATSAGTARPKWNESGYATWDALDDYLQTAAVDFSATDKLTVVVAFRKTSDAALGLIAELGASTSVNGSLSLFAPLSGSNSNAGLFSRGTASANTSSTIGAAPVTAVLTGRGEISTDVVQLRLNGVDGAITSTDQGTGNYANAALNIGARNGGASAFFNGRIYRLLVIGRALTTTERSLAERWAAQPAGVVLA